MTQTKPHENYSNADKLITPISPTEEKKYLDPVCGMTVSKNPDKMASHQGTSYYFCSPSCVTKFNAAPQNYVKAKKQQAMKLMICFII